MEAGRVGFIQEGLRWFLKCLGLEGGGGTTNASGEEVVNNQQPPPSPTASLTNNSLTAADDKPTAGDQLIDVLSSPIGSTAKTTDIDTNYIGADSVTLVTTNEIINTGGDTTAEARYVELLVDDQPNMSLLTTSLISSGGGGKSH